MSYIRYLSYPLVKNMPIYGAVGYSAGICAKKKISNGDSCNTYHFGIDNHIGTHVDAPAHYFEDGVEVSDYPAEHWYFRAPFVLDLEFKENELVEIRHLLTVPRDIDMLLIRSGFFKFRAFEKYSFANPGIDPAAAMWIRSNLLHVRAVGVDFISVSPYQNRGLGRETHKALLDPSGNNSPINIIEDMDLSGDLDGLSEVIALPMRLEDIDSAPCTVIGICKTK